MISDPPPSFMTIVWRKKHILNIKETIVSSGLGIKIKYPNPTFTASFSTIYILK